MVLRSALLLLASALAAAAPRASAQCEGWSPAFGIYGVDQSVLALVVHDDGSGPALYCGGNFYRWGDVDSPHIGRWDGTRWSQVGPGLPDDVHALAVFDDGGGEDLYAAGSFMTAGPVSVRHIARWDGQNWSALGSGFDTLGGVYALAVFDDGNGPALYAGGAFTTAGGSPASNIAKWDGASWSPLGSGIGGDVVFQLLVYDDGTGPALFAAGRFTSAGGVQANHIAKWDGVTWSALGGGLSGSPGPGLQTSVLGATVHDDGSGPALYVAGYFTAADGVPADRVARWDGTSWSGLDLGGIIGDAVSLGTFDDGTGPKLLLGGEFVIPAVAATGLLVRSGSAWTPATPIIEPEIVRAMATFDAGNGALLYLAGRGLDTIDFVGGGFAAWNGQNVVPVDWGPNTQGVVGLPGAFASCLASFDPGSELLVGGSFMQAGTVATPGLASWNGTNWSAPGLDEPLVTAVKTLDLGGVPWLLAGGPNYVAWRVGGAAWDIRHPFNNGSPFAFAAFDAGSGPEIYVGGAFNWGGLVGIGRYDGTNWNSVGGGVSGSINALAVYDDGSGPALYAGGTFTAAGGAPATAYLARWDGTSWTSVGGGMDGTVHALLVEDDGSGPVLYVGGNFAHAGAVAADRIARWNGTSWAALGAGFDDRVRALAVWDDGNGAALYAAGHFTHSGTQTTRHVARWSGTSWTEVSGGTNGNVLGLEVFDDGSLVGPDLYLAGAFDQAGGIISHNVARWRGCSEPGTLMCFGDGSLATPCPCGNFGMTSHGCQNSSLTGGATLGSSGTIVPDTVVLFAAGERPSALTIFLQGTQTVTAGVVFGDGLRCASGTLKRLYTKNASGGAVSAPAIGDPSITVRSAALGDPIAPGTRRYYQTYYRDSNLSFCPVPQGNTFNSSNAVKIVW